MYFNMDEWSQEIIDAKDRRFLPVYYFPAVKLTGKKIVDTVSAGCGEAMGDAMVKVIERHPAIIAGMTGMDLTVDSEAFGCKVRYEDENAPAIVEHLTLKTLEDVENLVVPGPHAGRQDDHYEAVRVAAKTITDRPIFGGQLGPYSLAANVIQLQKALKMTIKTPAVMHALLEKCTDFLIARAKEYKNAGANGVLLAEPTAGMLSAPMSRDFSSYYVKKIVDAVQDDSFYVILHDCGNVLDMSEDMYATGAKGFHFGNSVNMVEICKRYPQDVLIFGNIDPSALYTDTPEQMKERCDKLLADTADFPHFVFSTGCDVPSVAPIEQLDVMIESLKEFNDR